MTIAVFLLALGAALRLTHLLVLDLITAPIREFIQRRFVLSYDLSQDTLLRRISHLLWKFAHDVTNCIWCMSIWVCAGVFAVAATSADTKAFVYTAGALSASWLIALAETVHDFISSHEIAD